MINNQNKVSNLEEQNLKLFNEYNMTKSNKIRNDIVELNYHLPKIIAKKFVGRGVEYEDLLQVGSFALIKAVERFDVNQGVKFTTFATPTIIGEIKKYFRDKKSQIKIPRRLYEIQGKINLAKKELSQLNEKVPTSLEIANYLDVEVEIILEAMEAKLSTSIESIDKPILEDEKSTIGDITGGEDFGFEMFETNEDLKSIIDNLPEVERNFILLRYEKEYSQRQIAEKMNVSQMYISRMEKKVIKKIKSRYGVV